MTSHSKVNSLSTHGYTRSLWGSSMGIRELSWLLQLKAMKFWSREMLPALAEGNQPGLGCGPRYKEEIGELQFRDLLMTAGSATDLVEAHDSCWVPLDLCQQPRIPLSRKHLLSTCVWYYNGISTYSLAGKQSPLALAPPSLFSHHLGFGQCT